MVSRCRRTKCLFSQGISKTERQRLRALLFCFGRDGMGHSYGMTWRIVSVFTWFTLCLGEVDKRLCGSGAE